MFPLADCTEKTIDDYLNAAFGSGAIKTNEFDWKLLVLDKNTWNYIPVC